MLRNKQNQDSVSQLHRGDFAGLLNVADSAHSVPSPMHGLPDRRTSNPGACGKQVPGLLECYSGTGVRRSRSQSECGQRLRQRITVGIRPAQVRTVGNPPAAVWAALVIRRALSS